MKINNTDISTFGARQWRVSIDHSTINNASEWAVGAPMPYLAQSKAGFRRLSVTFLIDGTSRADIWDKASAIIAACMSRPTLTLDGFEKKFRGTLASDPTQDEKAMRDWHLLTLTFNGYFHGDPVTFTGTSSLTVSNPGTLPSPAVVVVTPQSGAASIKLNGICRDSWTGKNMPVTIKELTTGNAVTIDGLTGLITEGNDLKEIDAWALPAFKPGDTTVTCNNAFMTLAITVTPFYA